MRYQNIVMGLMLVAGLILFFINKSKEINVSTYVALALIASLGFISPMFGMVIAIPVFIIIFIKSQKGIAELWTRIESIKIQKGS